MWGWMHRTEELKFLIPLRIWFFLLVSWLMSWTHCKSLTILLLQFIPLDLDPMIGPGIFFLIAPGSSSAPGIGFGTQ